MPANQTIERQYAIADDLQLREVVCNAFRRLGYHINAPKNSRRITGTKQDVHQGITRFQFRFEVTAYVRSGSVTLSLAELNYKQIPQNYASQLTEVANALDEEARDYQEILSEKEPPTTYGTAKWATEQELLSAGYVCERPDATRLLLAPWGSKFLAVPQAQTNWHGLICGPTGAGKSSGFFIPNLCARFEASCIVTEATAGNEAPELYEKTAGWRHFQDSEIYYFNPDHLDSTRINPMDKVIFAHPEEVPAAAEQLAELIIINTSPPKAQRGDPIWDKSEKWLLWIMIMNAVASGDPEQCHFGAIRQMLRLPDKEISRNLSNSQSSEVEAEFRAFMSHTSENFRHGVFAGLLSRLNPWLTDKIVTLTRVTDFDIGELKEKLFTFYLSVPSRQRHLKPVAALIFNYLIDLALAGKNNEFKHPLALVLDEFTNFGAIPGIDEALSIIRRRNLPVVLGVQSFQQIEMLYGDDMAQIIREQLATRVYFRPRSRETARAISEELGSQTLVKHELTSAGDKLEREYGQPLMAVNDLLNMAAEEVVILTPTTKPIKTKRFDYKTYPAPAGYLPPERSRHKLFKARVSSEQLVKEEQIADEPAPPITTEERELFMSAPAQAAPEQPKKKKPKPDERPEINLEEEDFDIPG